MRLSVELKEIERMARHWLIGVVAVCGFCVCAEPVWHAGHETEMNEQLVFTGMFVWNGGEKPVLTLASSNPYRVKVNGAFVWYGPARGPRGWFRKDKLSLDVHKGENVVEIENAGYNCNSFYFMDQPSFLDASVAVGGETVLQTAAKGGPKTFEARVLTSRVRRVNRYSYQRMFAEVYDVPSAVGDAIALAAQPEGKWLPRCGAPVDFALKDDFTLAGRGTFGYDKTSPRVPHGGFGLVGNKAAKYKGYFLDELEYDTWDVATRVRLSSDGLVSDSARRARLTTGEYALYASPCNRTGFIGLTVRCLEPGVLHVFFDEMLSTNGLLDVRRNGTANTVVWRFTKPGVYEVEAFEPYTAKFVQPLALSGCFEVSAPRLRLYRSAASEGASLESSDSRLSAIFAAAEETYAQNAVDLFTDCPSRERAGWNCDAYFTGRTAWLLTGNSDVERQYLENYALPDSYEKLPKGMFPMCYPADSRDGNFIPSWALFMTLELDEYMRERNGDRRLAEAFRSKIFALVDYLKTFRNSDGLLEKLPRWVFVEWSRANKLVQDVNYPNNMVWAATLEAVDRLYGRPDLAAEAARVREEIRRQSWTGEWFCDNSVRQKDGSLKLSGECTETCQYYAFYFGVATRELYPELHRRLTTEFGPKRTQQGLYPEVWPANAFIGNYLRLEWLSREGQSRKVQDEVLGYFGSMAARTGTLWELVQENASCCHGFASHAAVSIAHDIVGVWAVDAAKKKVAFSPRANTGIATCVLTLPTADGKMRLGWRTDANGRKVDVCELPPGWRLR